MDNLKLVYAIAYEGPDLTMEGPVTHRVGEYATPEGCAFGMRHLKRYPKGRVNIRIQHRWVTDWEDSDG